MSHDRFRYAVMAAAFCLSTYVFFHLPSVVAGEAGPAVPWLPRILASFLFPAAMLLILSVVKAIARKDPYRENYARFSKAFDFLLNLTILLIFGIQLLLHGWLMIFRRWTPLHRLWFVPTTLIGILLILGGNVLPRLRPNSAIGIRTPWALRDEGVWARTHRAGGYVLLVFGFALLACTFVDFQKIWWVAAPGLLITLAGLPLLSYVLWKSGTRSPSHPLTDRKES